MDDTRDDRLVTRPHGPPGSPGSDPVLDRLDRLSDLLIRRLDRLEERIRSLEQDNGEIINLLIAVKAGLEEASGDLVAQLEEAEELTAGRADRDDGEDDSGFEVPCGPVLH
ncbi:hypothetical protein [Azospirillum picis]|uniref:Uncharacterized protein n=1 Tax=Azospirillum picis TaxID=488438 RepID=A0ABU0MPA7_9PROT|nr:hypothetical protein [Azospirillum picis]MBP2301468.1 hypothetical protein [Azospirillum picis]MDQ0535300.1 hypothetical protein [Azospirillum picis]